MKRFIIFLILMQLASSIFSQEQRQLIEETYHKNSAENIVKFLASDELEGRDTPSKGLQIAANYISDSFSAEGIGVLPGMENYFQSVKMISTAQPDHISIKIGEMDIADEGFVFHISGQSTSAVASWLMFDSEMQDLSEKDLSGKIIVHFIENQPNTNPRQILIQSREIQAKVDGAVGLIEVFEKDHALWERFSRYYERERIILDKSEDIENAFTHVVLYDLNGTFKTNSAQLISEEINIRMDGFNYKKHLSNNIIGFVEGKDPILKNEFIICSAHYDHAGIGQPDASGDSIYNGARDNAVGVMNVMMAADNLAKYPTKRSIIFILFTGEEKGLLGSKWFVDHPPVPLEDIVFCLNTDGAGYNDTLIATVIGLRRIKSKDIFSKACKANGLTVFEGTDQTQFLFNNSDNILFSRRGVPSVTFSPGFRDFDAEILKYYHQPSDEAETLDFNYLMQYTKSFGLSLRLIADLEERLFWEEGDEFYDIAKELYEN